MANMRRKQGRHACALRFSRVPGGGDEKGGGYTEPPPPVHVCKAPLFCWRRRRGEKALLHNAPLTLHLKKCNALFNNNGPRS